MPLVVGLVLTATAFGPARGDPPKAPSLLPPQVDPQVLAGRVLFAFGEAGLLLPPSLIEKDGSLAEVPIEDEDLDAGLPSVVSLLFPAGTVYGLGDVHGSASSKHLALDGRLALVPGSSFVLDGGLVAAASGEVDVRVRKSMLVFAELEGVVARASLSVGGSPLELQGTISQGNFDGGPVSFDGELSLVEDFRLQGGDPVTARLKAGGTLSVLVEKSALKRATFAEVSAEVDILLPPSQSTLHLKGTLSGTYRSGSIDFRGSLTLTDDFTFRRGPVTATLGSGGSLEVTVGNNSLRRVALEDVGAAVAITVGDRTLALHGTLAAATYKPDQGISFQAELEVAEPFVYEKGAVTATLQPGPATVHLNGRGNDPWVTVWQEGLPPLKLYLDDDEEEDDEE